MEDSSAPRLHKMLEFWAGRYSHPLNPIVIEAARAMIDKIDLSLETVLNYMEQIKPYRGLYNALAIFYFACDDAAGETDKKYSEITRAWQK